MRWSAYALSAALVLASTVHPGPPAAGADAKGTIRIGLLNATSGPYEAVGTDVNAGFQYFLATHGDQLGGFQVQLRTGDEGHSTESALAVAHQLVEQDSVDIIVGVDNSDDAYAIADYLEAQKKPLIITTAGAEELTQGKARRNLFRVGHTSSQDVMPLGDFTCRTMQKRNVAIIGVDYTYGWETAGGFARTYTAAGCRIVQEQYLARDGDWNTVIDKIDPRADAVFAALGPPDVGRFTTAYRAHPHPLLLGDSSLANEIFLRDQRDVALGVITPCHYASTIPSQDNIDFKHGYETLSGHAVSEFVENGYAAAQAISTALTRLPAGPVKADALIAQLRGVQFDAPRGPVRFDTYQQAVNDIYIRRVVQVGGKYRNTLVTMYPFISQFWHYDPQKYIHFLPYAKLKGTWARP